MTGDYSFNQKPLSWVIFDRSLLLRCPLSSHPRSANHPKKYRNSDFRTQELSIDRQAFDEIANLFNPFRALNNFEGSRLTNPPENHESLLIPTCSEFSEKLFRKSFTFKCTSSLRPRAMGALCEWNQNKSDWAVLHRAEANPDLCNSLYIDKVHSVRAFLHIMRHCYGFVLVASLSRRIRTSLELPQTTRASHCSKLNYSRVNRCLKEKVSSFARIFVIAPRRAYLRFSVWMTRWLHTQHSASILFLSLHAESSELGRGHGWNAITESSSSGQSRDVLMGIQLDAQQCGIWLTFFFVRWHHKNAPWNPHRTTRATENLI